MECISATTQARFLFKKAWRTFAALAMTPHGHFYKIDPVNRPLLLEVKILFPLCEPASFCFPSALINKANIAVFFIYTIMHTTDFHHFGRSQRC